MRPHSAQETATGLMARTWERRALRNADGTYELPLRFRVIPGTWPNITLTSPDGTRSDVTADAHEVHIEFEPAEDGTLQVDIRGVSLAVKGRTLHDGAETTQIAGAGTISLILWLRSGSAALVVDGGAPHQVPVDASARKEAAAPVTENVSAFRLALAPSPSGRITVGGGTQLVDARVFGLREPRSRLYENAARATDGPGRSFYHSDSFIVSDASVRDLEDGDAVALVPDGQTIVSPQRVVEEFEWRDNNYGDMTRVADRVEMWRSSVEPGRFPQLRTGFRTVDAAFELAMETFQRNSSGEFSLPGETGLWSAGYFQGSGLGFGSWRRDTCHIALRSGNLLDPKVARASLVHVADAGFDNGSDGDSLPAVAVWDYVLATGDESLPSAIWSELAATAANLDARFDESRSLVRAPQATSNDLFDEPEVGGYALSTEIYSMQTYAALAKMASLPHVQDVRGAMWAQRSDTMRRAITNQYWNSDFGYFTSGPVGTEAHRRGLWETSGAEAAVWGHLTPEADAYTGSVLRALRKVAMSEYGIVLYPHRDADDHFSRSVWYCWQAGFARAAAREGDAALVHQLVAQQVRAVIRNKTYYEVTNALSGESWRWPGQLWHAAGFASLILSGVLGIRYDADGMSFGPAVSAEFDGLSLDGLRYRDAVLDIEVRGSGTQASIMMDGRPVPKVATNVTGRHVVTITMTKEGDS